jgi:rhodanese-related sulfurtransferase
MTNISALELKERLNKGDQITIIDVRENIEYHSFNIGGMHVPLGKLNDFIEDCELNKEDEIVLICQRGLRSKTGTSILKANGFNNVRNLDGGLLAFRKLHSNY